MLKFCDALLDIPGDLAQYNVLLPFVLGETLDTIEVAANTVAELDFVLRMRVTVKLFGVKFERCYCFWALHRFSWIKFFESGGRCCVEVPILLIVSINLRFTFLINFE